MNAPLAASPAESLLFSWDPPRRRKVEITAFLAVSLIAHALCFYIFQVVYPPTVSLLPPPARVSVITPSSEEGRTLLRWIEAEDPALAFTTQRPPEARLRALPKIDHVPSYLGTEPALKEIPPLVVETRTPSSQPPGSVPFFHRQAVSNIRPPRTSIGFSNELEKFGPATLPRLSFTASSDEAPETIRFRVAVSSAGEIRYCFPLNSSGDPALDEQARRFLMLCRFSQSSATGEQVDQSLAWGIATIEWGADVVSSRPKPIGTARP